MLSSGSYHPEFMFYVYLITNGQKIYTGFTVDLKHRIAEHNSGKNFSTKGCSNWQLLYYEAHTDKKDAYRREKYLKTTYGKRAIKRMLTEALNKKKNLQ